MSKGIKEKKNRLAGSGSPYLRQHAGNPVDWLPWSDEVFEKARSEDKPVFLSIGYATCHWCHVMEKESFSDPGVAALMNETFVCVKVDREERPDVDHLYMMVCQLLTGSGGWPLTIILTPDQKPFFAGTYFPRGDRHGHPGMLQLIPQIRELWDQDRDKVNSSAREISEGVLAFMAPDPAADPSPELSDRAFDSLKEQYDPDNGGFGSAPKFPVFSHLMFLLRYWNRSGNDQALSMVCHTLEAMGRGGIFDQVGYGLHRYSTDERWFSPHFEKMLYDQALAIITCTKVFQATGEKRFRDMAERIICYVLRDLQSPEGCFYSAEDADSEGEEGRFYTWDEQEMLDVLGEEEMRLVRQVYNVTGDGNFSNETGQPTGRNILYRNAGVSSLPDSHGLHGDQLESTLERIREKLMEARSARIRPLRDEKVMTDWNGLMIAALARAAGAFGEERYTKIAQRALSHILNHHMDSDGRLLHLRYGPDDSVPAFLDDYAFLLWALLELHQSTFNADYLEHALKAADEMLVLYRDTENGGFFFTRDGSGSPGVRLKPSFDGPMPSGNSVAAAALIQLGRLTARSDLEEAGHGTLRAFATDMAGNPSGFTHMISILDLASHPTAEVIIAGDPANQDTAVFLESLRRSYLPGVSALNINPEDPDPRLDEYLPFARGIKTVNGNAAAYICRNFACQAPTTDVNEMLDIVGRRKPPGSEPC